MDSLTALVPSVFAEIGDGNNLADAVDKILIILRYGFYFVGFCSVEVLNLENPRLVAPAFSAGCGKRAQYAESYRR